MDAVLCDELLQEIFRRLPPPSFASVSLVSKRWLRLHRASTTSLSLRFVSLPPSFAAVAFLSHFPFLSSLTILSGDSSSVDRLLLAYSASSSADSLRDLRVCPGRVSVCSLLSLSVSCSHLTSLSIYVPRRLSLRWLASFRALKNLSLFLCTGGLEFDFKEADFFGKFDAQLPTESLYLTGIQATDKTLDWLWRNCKRLQRLRLRCCEGINDGEPFSSFLQGIQEVELSGCRSTSTEILSKLAQNCSSLDSLSIYDGGTKDGLLHFINNARCNLKRFDLRLPLDLDNDHLFAMARNFWVLSSLRLESCCLVTGEGLKAIAQAMASGLEELALTNCDVIEREPGFLATLGQSLKRLRKLDLSHNYMLLDKELISMLVSCNHLIELKLRGCKLLSNAALVYMFKSCRRLESVDIICCSGFEVEGIEAFVLNSPHLKHLQVDAKKLSDTARMWAARKMVEVVVN